MNLLLDTHIAIWALEGNEELSGKARYFILDPNNTIYYSAVSVWEVALKHSRKPDLIPFNEHDFSAYCKEAGYSLLNINEKHVLAVNTLSKPSKEHNDPFDRLLLAQAKVENFSFMTHDELIVTYQEKFIVDV